MSEACETYRASDRSRFASQRGATEFPLTDEQKARLQKTLREAFLKELGNVERFEIVTEPGPDVLMIKGAMLDVVSRVPPEPLGQATRLIELVDSQSGTVLARAVRFASPESNRRGFQCRNKLGPSTQTGRRMGAFVGHPPE